MDKSAIVASDTERLAQYCPDLESWPRSWSVEPRDIAPGQRLVECFKPFLLHLLTLELSRRTLRTHRDNLWILGGEIIRNLHEDPPLRKRPLNTWLGSVIDDEGGPLIYYCTSEEQQRSFDSTCRRFYRFLQAYQTTSLTR
ncbi:MAG: hypothetical protein M3461_09890 [Pseudomonadota bacterium]|nr:hypothetical protein [Pseudomonadota bacterium]